MSLFKRSSLPSPWVMCQSFSSCKDMAVAAKVSSNSQSPKRSQGLFPMYVYIGSLIGHPSRDLFSLSPVRKSGTSSFQECFLHDRPGHFLNKNYRISVMASQMVLWPSISSLSILIHIQPPDWLFYTILLYDFFIPKPPMTFPFHRTPASCFWCLSLPGLYHLLHTYLVWLTT